MKKITEILKDWFVGFLTFLCYFTYKHKVGSPFPGAGIFSSHIEPPNDNS
jgi:hypothetical protein